MTSSAPTPVHPAGWFCFWGVCVGAWVCTLLLESHSNSHCIDHRMTDVAVCLHLELESTSVPFSPCMIKRFKGVKENFLFYKNKIVCLFKINLCVKARIKKKNIRKRKNIIPYWLSTKDKIIYIILLYLICYLWLNLTRFMSVWCNSYISRLWYSVWLDRLICM